MMDEEKSVSVEEALFQEALNALEKQENAHAREILTRLIKTNPANPNYWLWMSAAVETNRERIYCLKEVLRIDPNNATAQRGLAMFGEIPLNPALAIPLRLQRRKWQIKLPVDETQKKSGLPFAYLLLILSGVIILAVVTVFLLVKNKQFVMPEIRAFQPALSTSGPTPTYISTPSPVVKRTVREPTKGITPLWMSLKETYTPTPIYVATPRQIEAYKLALRSYGRGDYEKALYNLNQVLTAEPKAPDLYFHLGEVYRLKGENNLAVQSYNKAISLDKNFAPPYLGLGQIILATNAARWQEAEKNFRKSIELDPDLIAAYLELANLYLNRDDGETALAELDAAPVASQDSPFFYFYRAQAYLLLDMPEKAESDASRANQMDVTMLPVYRLLGEALVRTGKVAQAAEPLSIYVTFMPDDDKAWGWLGAAYGANDQLDLALEAFDNAIALNKYSYDAFYQRGMIYLARDEGEPARKDLQMAVSIKPNSFEANIGLGRAFMLLEVYGNAWKYFATSEAFALSSSQKAEMLYWRAQSLEALEEIPSAKRDYTALIEFEGEDVPAEYIEFAQQRLEFLATPSPTPEKPTLSLTTVVTETSKASLTSTPEFTRTLTKSSTPTSTPTATVTPTP